MISKRTKEALASKRAFYARLTDQEKAELRLRGKATQLGGQPGQDPPRLSEGRRGKPGRSFWKADRRAADVAPIVHELQAGGASLRKVATALNDRHIPTSRGAQWTATQVARVMSRVEGR
jgi:hypothetical protein